MTLYQLLKLCTECQIERDVQWSSHCVHFTVLSLHILERWGTRQGGLLPAVIQTKSLECLSNILSHFQQILLVLSYAQNFHYTRSKKQKFVTGIQIQTEIHKLFKLKNMKRHFSPLNSQNSKKLRAMLQPETDAYLIIYSASSGRVVLLCLSTWYMYSSWPHDITTFSRPQLGLYIPNFVLK